MNKKIITSILLYIFAGVFILSAITKLIEPGIFEIVILNQGFITTRETASYLARLLLIMELFIGLALLQPYYLKKMVLPASLLSLIGFTVILLNSVFVGNNDNCGCFGEIIKMSPIEAIAKNIVLITIGIFIFLNSENKSRRIYIPGFVFMASLLIVLLVAPIKSHQDLKFSKYTNFSNNEIVDLSNGDKLVAVFFIDCEHCMKTANEIVRLENETSKLQNFYILFSGEETDSVQHFLNETNIEHPYLRIPIDDFFDLIGNAPPRIYWLDNGEVKEVWDDNFRKNLTHYIEASTN